MEASEGKPGRIFMLRLESGDKPDESIERFAAEKGILAAQLFCMAKEALSGIIAPDQAGKPRLRLSGNAESGDWSNAEVIIQEVVGIDFRRVTDPASGKETLARVVSTKTRVMEKAAPAPQESGPGTIPVYLFNAEFN